MLGLTIVAALGGFAVGSYAAYRYAPPLRPGPGTFAIGLILCALIGAAVGLACMYVYLAIYSFANSPGIDTGLLGGGGRNVSPDAGIFVGSIYSIATQSGVLLALAAGIFLLAPGQRDPANA